MNNQEICRAILTSTMTREDLDAVYAAAKAVGDRIASVAGMSFRVGDKVYFDGRNRGIINGEITKINKKSIKITSTTGMAWKVHPEFVRKRSTQG
mgnify:FL=1|jgi:hypothetical protein